MNFKQVEFSGGESSYHPKWFDMLKLAQKMNLKSSTLTNGLLFSDFNFIKKSNDLGLIEILFSVHGFKENHDKIVKVKGAFDKIINAIKNAQKLNIRSRVNITINLLNLKYIENIVDYLIDLGIYQFNFIEINNSHDAFKTASKQHKIIYQNLEKLERIFDKIINVYKRDDALNIRYIPFCKINLKYHKYMKNYIHHWFDKFDWNPLFIHKEDFNAEKIKAWKNKDINYFCKQLEIARDFWYYKTNECVNCKFNGVCDGFKKDSNFLEIKS
jgi:MoaA/NifB/PqqE/SkfB family radical SAM enzyme